MDIYSDGMDVPVLIEFLRPILTITTFWNTGETVDIFTFRWRYLYGSTNPATGFNQACF